MVDHSIVLFLEWNVLASLFTYTIKCSEIVFSIRCVNLWVDELMLFYFYGVQHYSIVLAI